MPTAYANVVKIDYLICQMSVNIMHYTHTHLYIHASPHSIYKILHKMATHTLSGGGLFHIELILVTNTFD